MTILTKQTIYLTENFFNSTIFIITISIAAFVGLIIGFWTIWPEKDIPPISEKIIIVFLFTLFSSALGSLIGAVVSQKTETIAERTKYEIYLEDMTYNELAESTEYTIVSTEGKKIIIVDKEWRYYEGYEK